MLQKIWCVLLTAAASAGSGVDSLRGRRLSNECDQGDVEALLPYEQKLMQDFRDGKSEWGRMCFDTTQGVKDRVAQALFILGMKSFSNFELSECTHIFHKLTDTKPDFVLGYWGRALCSLEFVWNSESPARQAAFLAEGRRKLAQLDLTLSDLEEKYYSALEIVSNLTTVHTDCTFGDVDPRSTKGARISQPCRLSAFLEKIKDIEKTDPADHNVAGFLILGNLAVAAVKCDRIPARKCSYLAAARKVADDHLNSADTNPAVLHFGLHVHDFPDDDFYLSGIPFAEKYPQYVNGSCHSTHMPSHIYDRAGMFSQAEESNRVSVAAADFFATSGALAFVGNPGWTPGTGSWIPSLGFAYNAANLYHSLEYQQYESLQLCNFDQARQLTDRMANAAMQAFAAAGAPGQFSTDVDFAQAWKNSTTYWQFVYRMNARFSLQVVLFKFLEGVGTGVPQLGSTGFSLPLPLSWEGEDVYSHSFYSPQSEAGMWTAIALDRLLQALGSGAPLAVSNSDDTQVWNMSCGDQPLSQMITCIDSIVAKAVRRIEMVQQKYIDGNIGYEANLTSALLAQVRSAASLLAGNLAEALTFAEAARDYEKEALEHFAVTSTSLYFIPGTAWHGIFCLRLLRDNPSDIPKSPKELLLDAKASFAHCLSPAGRPNHPACLLGAARVEEQLWEKSQGSDGRSQKAASFYKTLLDVWSVDRSSRVSLSPAESTCSEAVSEARKGSGSAHSDPPSGSQEDNKGMIMGIAIACVGICVGIGLGWYLGSRRSTRTMVRTSELEAHPFPPHEVECASWQKGVDA